MVSNGYTLISVIPGPGAVTRKTPDSQQTAGKYKKLLSENGEIYFKTDNDDLFGDSINYFEAAGFAVTTLIPDLHAADYPGNIETEHEKMYAEQGIKIKFLIATIGQS